MDDIKLEDLQNIFNDEKVWSVVRDKVQEVIADDKADGSIDLNGDVYLTYPKPQEQ